MQQRPPSYTSSHIAAFAGVLLVHGGLMAWQLLPQPPVAIPQQQVIRISMVAPSTPPAPPQAQPEPPPAPPPAPEIPPAPKGMKKAEPPQPQREEKKPAPPEKTEAAQPQPPAPVMQTSGQQAPDATQRQAAITEPVAADYLRNPPPVYPRAALRKRQQGTVLVAVQVSMQGLPLRVRIDRSSGHRLLDAAALEAVRNWRFVPARRGSERVEAGVVVPVEFRIN